MQMIRWFGSCNGQLGNINEWSRGHLETRWWFPDFWPVVKQLFNFFSKSVQNFFASASSWQLLSLKFPYCNYDSNMPLTFMWVDNTEQSTLNQAVDHCFTMATFETLLCNAHHSSDLWLENTYRVSQQVWISTKLH